MNLIIFLQLTFAKVHSLQCCVCVPSCAKSGNLQLPNLSATHTIMLRINEGLKMNPLAKYDLAHVNERR